MWTYFCTVVVLLYVVGVKAEDKSVTVGNITTKVKGQSGKILIYKGTDESNGVTVTFDAIEEIDTSGDKIQSHSYNNFARLTFTFSDPKNATYPNSNASVTQFSFMAMIVVDGGNATLKSYVYIFTSDGNITVDGNEHQIREGDMKFNAEITDWPFCATCKHGNKNLTGEYLDFSVEIKGKKETNKTDSENAEYDLGDGASVITPREVIYTNGTTNRTENMPTGYPKLELKGSKQIFIFRFKKFTDKVLYDPIVTLRADSENKTDGGDSDGGKTETEKEITAAGISTKILGNSGKITITNAGGTEGSHNSVTVEFRNLQEKTANGMDIKDSTHSINSFASQVFTFSTVMNVNYPGTSVAVSRITFESTLKNNAVLKVHLYVFKAGGNITQDNENTMVEKGNVKFNIEISGWSFCSNTVTCTQNEVGADLDFDIIIKGKGDAKKETGLGKYSLGTGHLILSKKVTVDGSIVNMTGDYPMAMMQGSKQIFRFRFPKFVSKILYDPVIIVDSGSTSSASKVTFTSITIAAMCYFFHML